MDTRQPFVIQKPNQWDDDPEDGPFPPPYYPHSGDADSSPRLQLQQHPNLGETKDYFSEPETPDLDVTMDTFKRARIINLREVRAAKTSPKTSPTSRPGLPHWSSTGSDDSPAPVSTNGRLPDLRESSSTSSSTSSLASTSSSATNSVGNRQLKLRVTSVLHDFNGQSSGLLTPVTNDSYEELVKSLRLIHDIDDDLQIEVMIRGAGFKLCQTTMSDLMMNDVLDIRIFEKSLYRNQPPRPPPRQPLPPLPPHQPLPSPPQPSLVSAPVPISAFPAPSSSTSSPTSQPNAQPNRLPQRANTQHVSPNNVFDHHATPSAPATHVNSHKSISPPSSLSPPSSPSSTAFNHSLSPFNKNRSRLPQAISPQSSIVGSSAISSFMRRGSLQIRSLTPTQARSPTPTQARSPTPTQARSPTPTFDSIVRRSDTIGSVSVSSTFPPAYSDFHITISPPIYEKGHISLFPAKPFTLTRTHDGVFTISTVSSIRDVLKKKFPECPEVIFYHKDTELDENKRLCDMGIIAGTKLRLVDKANYRLVPARLHDSLLEMM
ncbi:hypothetical protein BC937DRAFT_86441 [Endogone sp. FLAS-F59071]|nr:hypothetical protein BC937DRAFT_86441 [Endogone sp. FLAS-F59071]|eukprot:RUS20073.1 hypothetical protein BC937DRAFT_86441 [Endogone sp. FLAS-F59071]